MQIKLVELKLVWPKDITVLELRLWVKNQLRKYGEPLRWAITDIGIASKFDDSLNRELTIEAVVIDSIEIDD